jgi:hypothetical protein
MTGQVLRIDGDRVQRMRGWSVAGEYVGTTGKAATAEELVVGLPEIYGLAPTGRP